MKFSRHKTRVVKIGNVKIGAGNPVAIQSMAKTETADVEAVLMQINELKGAGCEIVRLAVKSREDALALRIIRNKSPLPIVVDIHFNWRFAIMAIDGGVDKIRLNPGNIYKPQEIKEIARAAKQAHIPVRVGVNSGSLKALRTKDKGLSTQADKMVKSALDYVKILERCGFYDIVISLKGSNIIDTIEAYRKIAGVCDYPLHLGATATGVSYQGLVKSSIAIGTLLLEGIGDTIRVSLTDEPVAEVRAARAILEATNRRRFGHEIISCPTCGRCEVDLVKIVNDLERKLLTINHEPSTRHIKIAVMGCMVNGPGEAKEADIGIAFGKNKAAVFRAGSVLGPTTEKNAVSDLIKHIRKAQHGHKNH